MKFNGQFVESFVYITYVEITCWTAWPWWLVYSFRTHSFIFPIKFPRKNPEGSRNPSIHPQLYFLNNVEKFVRIFFRFGFLMFAMHNNKRNNVSSSHLLVSLILCFYCKMKWCVEGVYYKHPHTLFYYFVYIDLFIMLVIYSMII